MQITEKISDDGTKHAEQACVEQSHQSCVLAAIALDGSSMLGINMLGPACSEQSYIEVKRGRSNHVGSSMLGTVT